MLHFSGRGSGGGIWCRALRCPGGSGDSQNCLKTCTRMQTFEIKGVQKWGSQMDNFEGSSSNCTCSETSRNVVLSEFRRFHTGKRSSGGAVILTLEFVAYSALFSPGLRELLGYSSEPLSDFCYTIKLGKTENGCPTGKATVCTRVQRRS